MFIKSITTALLALLSAAAFAAVDVNKASQGELESVKGIGPTMSTKIVDARKSGPFADWSDLQARVKGVGHGNASKFSADGLTVNGTAYTGTAPAKPAKVEKADKAKAMPATEKKPAAPKAAAPASK
jgi:competence protein ComEA